MEQQIKQAVIETVVYADIFNYPLTQMQLWEYAISSIPFSREQLLKALPLVKEIVSQENHYYFLKGRNFLVANRRAKIRINEEKLAQAQKVATILSIIPTIRFIGISGSVAMCNADKDDDIDLFFITSPRSVWISRLLVAWVLEVLGVRRRKDQQHVTNSICANMFIACNSLAFSQEKQNLYIAHEIAQVLPLYSVGDTYEQLIDTNRWIHTFLSNWKKKSIPISHKTFLQYFAGKILLLLDPVVRFLQLRYMEKSRTTETVGATVIAFHPQDRIHFVMHSFRQKCKAYDL